MRARSVAAVAAVLALFAGCLALVVGSPAAATPAAATPAAATTAAGAYTAVTPTRVLDTRTSVGGHLGAVGPSSSVAFTVTGGKAVIPTTAAAVVLNVTVTGPTSSGYITASAYGRPRPGVSNLNFAKGQTVPNLVVAPVGSGGRVSLYNGSAGRSQLIADIQGYFTGGAPAVQGAFAAVTPTRLLDTRTGTGATKRAVSGNGTVSFAVTGTHGSATVPSTASAVVLNVTATASTSSGYITAYGNNRPASSNLNYAKGRTVPGLVVVPVGAGGRVSLYNGSTGSVQLIADIQGYFAAGDPTAAGAFGALSPARLLDTRYGTGAPRAAVKAHQTVTISLAGRGGVPRSAVAAAALNVTVTGTGAGGYLTVYSGNRPTVSNLNFGKSQTIANLVLAKPSSGETVTFYNGSSGSVQIIADAFGYVRATTVAIPTVSTGHYVRNLTGVASSDASKMYDEGCADKESGSSLVLLDIGAQSTTAPLSDATPGVALTATNPTVRLTYEQLVTALNGYFNGFATCSGPVSAATVALGTNNDGTWSTYTGPERGADWARNVVDAVEPHLGITIAGANDIESSFGTEKVTDAQAWETAYLSATTKQLIFNGSADGCPTTYGTVGATCAKSWTQAQYYALAHNGSRISVLPQIYYPELAVQWANIDVTGGGALVFAGSLTEHAAACGADCAMTPAQGWAALYHAISTVTTTPTLPAAVDLRID